MIECVFYSNKGPEGIVSILGNGFSHLIFEEISHRTGIEVQQKHKMRYIPQTRCKGVIRDENELGYEIGRRFYEAGFNLTVFSGDELLLEIVRKNGRRIR